MQAVAVYSCQQVAGAIMSQGDDGAFIIIACRPVKMPYAAKLRLRRFENVHAIVARAEPNVFLSVFKQIINLFEVNFVVCYTRRNRHKFVLLFVEMKE